MQSTDSLVEITRSLQHLKVGVLRSSEGLVRCAQVPVFQVVRFVPSQQWLGRVQFGRVVVNRRNDDVMRGSSLPVLS